MKRTLPIVLALATTPVFAEDTREADAHEHGVGTLNIAFEGNTVAMEFHAPGSDIVGFEYAAESAKDRAAIDAAVATLARPADLFVMPAGAECTVTQASAALESEEEHAAHDDDHDDHAKHNDDHDDHDDHAKHDDDHDDHEKDEDHAENEEHSDEHEEHEEHAEEASHTEFHAEYQMTCANPSAIDKITFAYFDIFENAREVEVQIVSASGAQAFEVERDEPTLDLRNLF